MHFYSSNLLHLKNYHEPAGLPVCPDYEGYPHALGIPNRFFNLLSFRKRYTGTIIQYEGSVMNADRVGCGEKAGFYERPAHIITNG